MCRILGRRIGALGLFLGFCCVLLPTPASAQWLPAKQGQTFHSGVVGGAEGDRLLYLCRGTHSESIQVGKIVDGKCNVAFEGAEIALTSYERLTSGPVYWAGSSRGIQGAKNAGRDNGQPVYLCRARLTSRSGNGGATDLGVHPGKVVEGTCRIGFGGKEIRASSFDYGYSVPPSREQVKVSLINQTGQRVVVAFRQSAGSAMSNDCASMFTAKALLRPTETISIPRGEALWLRVMDNKVPIQPWRDTDLYSRISGCNETHLLYERVVLTNPTDSDITVTLGPRAGQR